MHTATSERSRNKN